MPLRLRRARPLLPKLPHGCAGVAVRLTIQFRSLPPGEALPPGAAPTTGHPVWVARCVVPLGTTYADGARLAASRSVSPNPGSGIRWASSRGRRARGALHRSTTRDSTMRLQASQMPCETGPAPRRSVRLHHAQISTMAPVSPGHGGRSIRELPQRGADLPPDARERVETVKEAPPGPAPGREVGDST